MWMIDEGLKPGDRVVAEGVQKVKEGLAGESAAYLRGRGNRRRPAA